jgi:hypothetical protein
LLRPVHNVILFFPATQEGPNTIVWRFVERVHENGTLATCEELGIGFVPWDPAERAGRL